MQQHSVARIRLHFDSSAANNSKWRHIVAVWQWALFDPIFWTFRLIEWIFYHVNSEDKSTDEVKAVFLKGLYELLSSEGGKSPHAPMLPVSMTY